MWLIVGWGNKYCQPPQIAGLFPPIHPRTDSATCPQPVADPPNISHIYLPLDLTYATAQTYITLDKYTSSGNNAGNAVTRQQLNYNS